MEFILGFWIGGLVQMLITALFDDDGPRPAV